MNYQALTETIDPEAELYIPADEREIHDARMDVTSEREVVLSAFQEVSWGGCAARNS